MELIHTKIKIGLDAPVKVIHMTDTHLTHADLRDGERKVALAEKRAPIFPHADEVLAFARQAAKEHGVPILHTGDLMDFVSEANLEAVKAFTGGTDCFMAAGNHEFALYVGEAKEDAAYRNRSLNKVQAVFRNDIRAAARIIDGVNFIALDNGYYLFEKEQLAFLKKEGEKGLPMVLLMHTPLFERALYDREMAKSSCAYLVGVPEELMQTYSPHRYEQQLADKITLETVDYIRKEPLIKALITGHLHYNYEGLFTERIPQIVTSCTDLRLIELT